MNIPESRDVVMLIFLKNLDALESYDDLVSIYDEKTPFLSDQSGPNNFLPVLHRPRSLRQKKRNFYHRKKSIAVPSELSPVTTPPKQFETLQTCL